LLVRGEGRGRRRSLHQSYIAQSLYLELENKRKSFEGESALYFSYFDYLRKELFRL
jgi:hypothetical protein